MISVGGNLTEAGAANLGGFAQAAPANFQLGSIGFDRTAEGAMTASIVHLLARLAEVEAERDFYKAAAGKLAKGGRKQ